MICGDMLFFRAPRACDQVEFKFRHIIIGSYIFKGCKQEFQKRSEYLVFFGRHVGVDFFRGMAQTFLIVNDC